MAKYLLEQKAKVNEGIASMPLDAACTHGDLAMVKFLVEEKADMNAKEGGRERHAHTSTHHTQFVICCILRGGFACILFLRRLDTVVYRFG